MPRAVLSNVLRLPVDVVGDLSRLRSKLTVQPVGLGDDPPPDPVLCMWGPGADGMVGVPVQWGLDEYPHLQFVDRTSEGGEWHAPSRADPNHPSAAPGQEVFRDDLLQAVQDEYMVLVQAETGAGKTVVSLDVAAALGRSVIAMCHRKKIREEWHKTLTEIFNVPDDEIGFIEGKKMQVDRPVCLALYQTIIRRDPADFADKFGTAIWDEVHTTPTAHLTSALYAINAQHRIALTATPRRRDGTWPMVRQQFGDPKVVADVQVCPVNYQIKPYRGRTPWGRNHQQRMQALARDRARAEWLAQEIVKLWHALPDPRHAVLAVSERLDLIETVKSLLLRRNDVADNDIGEFIGSVTEGQDKAPTTPEYLDWVRRVPTIIFSTHTMITEGVDIPRIAAGIELTPRGKAAQLVGRGRRPFPGKNILNWVSPLDTAMGPAHGYLTARIKDLKAHTQNVTVIR